MPRVGAKGKWNLKMSPDEWYLKPDPWGVEHSKEEILKATMISGLIEHDHVMDIGCGEGRFTHEFYYHDGERHVIGIDISPLAIGRAKYNYNKPSLFFETMDISGDFYFESAREFTIIMSEVLYYIKPSLWESVVENIYNILSKHGGQFIISVGQYFTEADIRDIFSKIEFDKVYKLPSKKYEYNLIMSGHYVG